MVAADEAMPELGACGAKGESNLVANRAETPGLPATVTTWQEISTGLADNLQRLWGSNPDAL
jgi:hypothetical protein